VGAIPADLAENRADGKAVHEARITICDRSIKREAPVPEIAPRTPGTVSPGRGHFSEDRDCDRPNRFQQIRQFILFRVQNRNGGEWVQLATGRTRTPGYCASMAIETRNVIGSVLKPCSLDPLTGWHRDGCCRTGAGDQGVHVVCARVSDKFLQFSKVRGNDLTTPRPEFGFPGLKAGDQWCLCAARWQEAFEAGCAPDVVLEATHESALEFIDLESLKAHAC
jgi:uncharacterized protein (DUF2237 family)